MGAKSVPGGLWRMLNLNINISAMWSERVRGSFLKNVSYLDVGRVEIAEGSQGCRETVGAAAYPQRLQDAGWHACFLTQTLFAHK